MALDQAILESTSARATVNDDAVPTLRFYGWSSPTLSLGYFQSHRDLSVGHSELCQVRRSTGGGAIIHHHELTYSLTIPTGADQRLSRQDLYVGVHSAIIDALASLGVSAKPFHQSGARCGTDDAFLCFQRRTDEDLIVSGYKIAGSAQRRARASLLQHGSILLRASRHAPQLPGIVELTSRLPPIELLCDRIGDAIGGVMEIDWAGDVVSENERRRTVELVNRFESSGWWLRR